MKRLVKKNLLSLLLSVVGFVAPASLRAQFLGYTSPQSFNQQVFSGQTTTARTPIPTTLNVCTPTNGNPCGVRNLGQTFHYLTYTTTNPGCVVDLAIVASFDGTNFFNISSDASAANGLIGTGASVVGGVYANGWFPIIAINLSNISNCVSGVSAFYSGSSSAASGTFGVFTQSLGVRQAVFQNANLTANTTNTLPTPFSSTGGKLYLICTVTCGAGTDQFSVLTAPSPPATQQTIAVFTAANNTNLQVFTVPAVTAPYVQLLFSSGNFTTTNASLYYEFDSPGSPAATVNSFKEIASNASTQVRTGIGFLENIVVNAPGTTWTMQIFDNTACSGTAIAGATAFTVPAAGSNLRYDTAFTSGLCILTAGGAPAGSITVSFR
jgi:hypothetical protein